MASDCDRLVQLRREARKVYNELEERKKRARAKGLAQRDGRKQGHTEYEGLLRRQIDRLSRQIDQHLAEHDCQE